jgi:tetratricopeptide (TPR) repeat protein
MKQQPSPLEILEYISLAGTAAGTVSVILLSQHVGYALGPGAFSLVLGAANRKLSKSGSQATSELVQIDQKLSADLASVRQQVQGLPSSKDYSSLKLTVENLSNSLGSLEEQKPAGQLANVGAELNPIRQDIVQLRSQYGNLQQLLAELRDRIETLPAPDKLQTVENELKQLEAKLAQLPILWQKMNAEAGSADLTAVNDEIANLKEQLSAITSANDINYLAPELQVLKGQVEALENTSDRLVVETEHLAEKEEVRSLISVLQELQTKQQELQETTANDQSALTSLADAQEALQQQLDRMTQRLTEEMPAAVKSEDLQELQQRLQKLKEQFELRMAVASVEVKDGQTVELAGVEDALAKIAGAVSEVKVELDSRLESIESVELKMIHEQLLDQQATLTSLQQEYQNLLASTSESNTWVESLSESEYSQKIASLERALANTTESIDRIESSLNTNGVGDPPPYSPWEIDADLSVLAPEIEQIGFLKNTVSQLAGNLENLEKQVDWAINNETETSTAELRLEIDALKDSLNALENAANNRDQDAVEIANYPFIEINILSQELEQIGILKDTVYQLSGNVEILDQQVHALAMGRPDSMTGQLQEQMDLLTTKVEELSASEISGDLTTAYETVVQRLEQVETACLSLEEQINLNQDFNSQTDGTEVQLQTLNAQLSNLQQETSAIGQKLIEFEQGIEQVSVAELEATRQDVSLLQATVDDLVNRLEDELGQSNATEEVQELAAALSTLETKLSLSIASLDDGFQQLQLQTNQLAAEQAESSATTSQVETLVANSIDRQMGEISQLLQDVAPCDYQLLFDRPEIQECIATTIDNSYKRLIIVSPWLSRETMSGVLEKLAAFLERNGQLQIGWGHLADINAGEFPVRISQQWETDALTKRRQSYDALNEIEALRQKYPHQVEYKILGTHENFLVADDNFALISSHHFLSGDNQVPEREVAIQTSSMKIIQGLRDRFQDPVLKPGSADAYYNRGFERLEIGDYQGAMADYARAAELNPHQTTIYNNLGLAKYSAGDVAGAIADYTKAIEQDSNEPVTYFNRAVAYYKLGDYRKSIADYTQVIQRQDGIRISAENTGAYFQRAEAYRQLGEYESAIYDYTMAIRLAPNDPVAYNNRGLARYNQGDYLGSIQDYSEALALNSNDAVAYSNRGVSRLKSGDYAGAVADFDGAINLKPDYASAYNNRGLARVEIGDRSGAIGDLEQAAELFAAQGNLANQQQALDSLKRLGSQTE